MTEKVPSDAPAAQAALVTTDDLPTQVQALAVDVDCLDRALVEVGTTADRALAKANGLEAVLRAALDRDDDEPGTTASFGDRVSARIRARRRRIERSGFRLIAGGAQ